MLGHKENLNKLQRIDFIQSMFSDQSGIKLEIKNKEKTVKISNLSIKQHIPK